MWIFMRIMRIASGIVMLKTHDITFCVFFLFWIKQLHEIVLEDNRLCSNSLKSDSIYQFFLRTQRSFLNGFSDIKIISYSSFSQFDSLYNIATKGFQNIFSTK